MDEMGDSLFEGMVLFDPLSSSFSSSSSSSSTQLPVADDNNNHDDIVELHNHREISQQPPKSAGPAAAGEPLDENLFSDLTLVQPQSQDDPSSPSFNHSPIPSPSSQTSTTIPSTSVSNGGGEVVPRTRSISSQTSITRKKKKAGLRIGYGRSTHFHDSNVDPSNSTSPSPSSSLVVAEEKAEPEEGKQKALHDSAITPDSTIAAPHDSQVQEQIKINMADPNSEINIQEEEIKQDSVEFRYDQVKARISDKLNRAQQAVASLSAKRKDLIRKRRKAAEELNLASEQHKEMEKELEEAVESEDFEMAERVSDSLASAEKNKERLSIAMREAEAECDAIDSKIHEALELQIATEEECAVLLESFAVDADHNADSVISKAETKTSEEMEKWLSLSEALEVKKMEVEIESHVLSGAQALLDDSIEHTVKDDRKESELLQKKKKFLAEELEQLLALVKQKEAEIAENDSKIEAVEKRMADAVSSFQEAESNIRSKLDDLQSGLSKVGLDDVTLCRKKKEIDDFLFREEERGSKIREISRISKDEAGVYQEVVNLRKSLVEFISKSREEKGRLATTEQKLFDDVQKLKQDISAVRASLQDLSSTKSGIQQAIESSKQRLVFIEKRVPELESEKKVAATARNFKEAARIANEAKTLYVEKETLQTKTEAAMIEHKKIEEDINHNVNKLKEKEEHSSSMEKELERVRYQRLVLAAGAASAERSAATELGDVEEAEILRKEAQAAHSEARKLKANCEFKEEEFDGVSKPFISMELVSTLDKKQLVELLRWVHHDA